MSEVALSYPPNIRAAKLGPQDVIIEKRAVLASRAPLAAQLYATPLADTVIAMAEKS